jgi:hypothetical protein
MPKTPTAPRSLDVSGLPDEAVRALEALVSLLRGKDQQGVPGYSSPEEWSRALREWAGSHPRLDSTADDSRESIYAGRGE